MKSDWLTRPTTIRRLWIAFLILLAGVLVAEFAVDRHAVFGLDGIFGFNAVYGFAACVALVLGSKLLGAILKRPDDYHD